MKSQQRLVDRSVVRLPSRWAVARAFLLCAVLLSSPPALAQNGARLQSMPPTNPGHPTISRETPLRTHSGIANARGVRVGLDEYRMFATGENPTPPVRRPAPSRVAGHPRDADEDERAPRTEAEVVDRVSRVIAEASAILKAGDAASGGNSKPAVSEPVALVPSGGDGPQVVDAGRESLPYADLGKLNATESEPAAAVGPCRAATERRTPFVPLDRSERIDLLVFDPSDVSQRRKVERLSRRDARHAIPYEGATGGPSLVTTDPLRMFVDGLGLRCLPSRIVSSGATLRFYEGSRAFETRPSAE